ncbi:MAG: Lrp/AsnC ligand binding domain-containing protein [Bacteroidales bacterium]|nr:Lrp/AsnC ligand binding domain-containing protein [Bacteroidales bacterium]
MSEKFQIDSTDRKILSLLMNNARTPFLEVARECGVSGAAIHQRVQKLEEAGYISGSHYKVNPVVAGLTTCAFIGIFLEKPTFYKSTVEELKKIPEVVECHYTTGDFSTFVKIYCKDNADLTSILINKIQPIQGVSRTETYVSLEQQIDRPIPIF